MAVHISIRVWYIPEALSGGYFWNTFNLKGYHIGNALWVVMATGAIQVYGVSCIFRSALFYELAKWRRLIRFIWLQKKSSKVFAIQAVSRIEYVTLVDDSFRRSLLLSGKVRRLSSFCKHTTSMWGESHTRCPIFLHKDSMLNQDIIQWSGSCILIIVVFINGVTCGTVLLFICWGFDRGWPGW